MAKVKLVAWLAVLSVVALVILADDTVHKASHGSGGHFAKDRVRSHVTPPNGEKRRWGQGHRNGGHSQKGHGVGRYKVGDGEHLAVEHKNHLLSAPDVKASRSLTHHGHISKHAGKRRLGARDGLHPKSGAAENPQVGIFRQRSEHRGVNRRGPGMQGHGHSIPSKPSHHVVGQNRHGSGNHIRHSAA